MWIRSTLRPNLRNSILYTSRGSWIGGKMNRLSPISEVWLNVVSLTLRLVESHCSKMSWSTVSNAADRVRHDGSSKVWWFKLHVVKEHDYDGSSYVWWDSKVWKFKTGVVREQGMVVLARCGARANCGGSSHVWLSYLSTTTWFMLI